MLLSVGLIAAHPLWLPAFGILLVQSEQPFDADVAVVLGGDHYGHRVLKAADLVKQGLVRKVLVSGSAGYYGFHETDLAVPFAVQHGYPEEWFTRLRVRANSTEEEARAVIPKLRRLGVQKYLLVTTDFHTRRAASIFRRVGPDLPMRVVAAPDEFFRARTWWHDREGRKTVFMEWSKTIAGLIGL